MVEALGQRSSDVLSLQPMDSHFIYQAVNLRAPNAPLHRNPATQPERGAASGAASGAELLPKRCPCSLHHTCIVFAMDQLKGWGSKKRAICKMDVL